MQEERHPDECRYDAKLEVAGWQEHAHGDIGGEEQRSASKMVNFGIAYGLSPHGLSTRLNISNEEAAKYFTDILLNGISTNANSGKRNGKRTRQDGSRNA